MPVGNKTIYPWNNKTIIKTTFDISADSEIVAAAGTGIKIKVVAILFYNNDTTETNDEKIFLRNGNGGTILFGGSSGGIYLVGRGGFFQLGPWSTNNNYWFETSANTALYMDLTNGRQISGAVWHVNEK